MTPPAPNPYWTPRVRALTPYTPGEQPTRPVIKLNTNENPYPPSPAVIDAIHRAATDRLRLYPDPTAAALRDAIARRHHVHPDEVFVGNGSDEILAFAFAALFTRARFPDVTYSFYPVYAGLWDIPYTTVPLRDDFTLAAEDYAHGDGGVIFPNPNAPTGRAVSIKAISELTQGGAAPLAPRWEAAASQTHPWALIVDEAYIAFATEPGVGTAIPLIHEHPNLLVIRTLSKDASLAGLRAGYAIGQRGLIEALCRVRDSFNSYTLDRVAQAAAAAAIDDAPYYDAVNRRVAATRDRVAAALTARGLAVIPSQANFLLVRHPALPGRALFTRLRDQGILVRHFDAPRVSPYIRVTIATDPDMDAFLAALPPA